MPDPSGNTLPGFVAPERETLDDFDWLTRLRHDQQKRWRRGERPLVEVYLRRFQMLRQDPEALLDMIYQEILLREEGGEAPQSREYAQRFPTCREQIEQQFVVHRALQSPALLLAGTAEATEESLELEPMVTAPAVAESPTEWRRNWIWVVFSGVVGLVGIFGWWIASQI
jgi:hypothetical protein